MPKWWYVITPRSLPQDRSRVLYRRKEGSFEGFEIHVVPVGEGGQNVPAWRGAVGFLPDYEWIDWEMMRGR